MTNNNVLLLTTYYPPANSIGGRRAYGLAKYLPKFGWTPYVITIKWTKNIDIMGIDPLLEAIIEKQDNITRVPYRPNKYYPLFQKLWRWRRVLLFPQTQAYDYFKNTMQLFPDYLAKNNIAVIWATHPHPAPHLIANKLRSKYSIPWIADFRDLFEQRYTRLMLRLIVPHLLKNCSEITTVSPALVVKLQNATNKNVSCIYNGFDPDEYASLPPCIIHKKFTLVYTGRLILPEMSPASVFSAIELLLNSGTINPKEFILSFYGSDRRSVAKLLQGRAIKHCCEFKPVIPHSQVPAIQNQATILLHLSHPNQKGIMTGKIFEYLAARRPIISVPGDNDCVDKLLDESKAGCSRGTVEQIALQIKEWYKEWKQTGHVKYYGIDSEIAKYSYPEMAKQVTKLLNRAIRTP